MFSRIFAYVEEGVLNLAISLMTILVFVEVIARFFFNTGFLWIQELTLTIAGWFVLFGMSYGVKVGAHIGVDAFVSKLPRKGRKIAALIAATICIFYCLLFLKGSWDYLSQMYKIGVPMEDIHFPHFIVSQLDPDQAWEILRLDVEDPAVPLWISQSILLIGFALLTWRFIELTIAIITNKAVGFSFHDEAKESMHLADEVKGSDNDVQNKQDQ
ncbi:TRAP transporter small permease [Shewanella sp. C32]|uniref:TRAP transporter small permease protein n=1 Tax=Shewanella electrica TaxID=515560 RepID=A0ABT2FMY3_9GAMM|nr:TRAP transporter small permease [Shewanella electrica]MCH1924660.1 TRAP transporter small permease [Shewanella electrica]MCS4556561.1 TRAP transporter small permease [Shewanella electrica]